MSSIIIPALHEDKTRGHVVRFAKNPPILADFVIKGADHTLLTPIN